MDENILNIWLQILYENLSNKKILFLKVNTGDTKNFSESLNIFIRKDISIINIDILKEKNWLEKIGANLIIISDSLEPIENMKLILNREIIYIEDVNSINKLVELLNNKSLDYYNEIKYDFLQKVNFEKLIKSNPEDIEKFVSNRLSLLEKINSYGAVEGRVSDVNGTPIRLSDLLEQRAQLETEFFNDRKTLIQLTEQEIKDSTFENFLFNR